MKRSWFIETFPSPLGGWSRSRSFCFLCIISVPSTEEFSTAGGRISGHNIDSHYQAQTLDSSRGPKRIHAPSRAATTVLYGKYSLLILFFPPPPLPLLPPRSKRAFLRHDNNNKQLDRSRSTSLPSPLLVPSKGPVIID